MRVVSGLCCGVLMAGGVTLAACGSVPSTDAPGAAGTARTATGSPAQGVLARGTAAVSAASASRFAVRVQRNGDVIARRQGGGPGPGAIGVWSTAGR